MTTEVTTGLVPLKLESARGTLLGTIFVQPTWVDSLLRTGHVMFYLQPPLPSRGFSLDDPLDVKKGALERSWRSDAVILWGLTLEELERVRGVHFAPSAAYLRSIVDGPIE